MLFVCVLFIGNSLTFANDLPGMVRALVDSSVYLLAGEAWEAAPGGLPARLRTQSGVDVDVPPALARLLQEAAADANQRHPS